MPAIDFNQILADSISVAKSELGNKWKNVKPFAEHEFRQLAENVLFLTQLHLDGTIDMEELKWRLQFQKIAACNVLLAIQGIGLVAAQNTVNAIIGIISNAIKTALGISIPT